MKWCIIWIALYTRVKNFIKMLKDVGMTELKTLDARLLYADKGKGIWHEKQGARAECIVVSNNSKGVN